MKQSTKSLFAAFLFIIMLCPAAHAQKETKESREAKRQAVVQAINDQDFDVILTQNVPKTSQDAIINYTGEYSILIRGDKASVFIPGVNQGGIAVFGGINVGDAEPFEMSCKKISTKKIMHTFELRSVGGKDNYVITVRAYENTNADIIVDRVPMDRFKFYGEVATH